MHLFRSSSSAKKQRPILRTNVRRDGAPDALPVRILIVALALAGLLLAGWGLVAGFRGAARALFTQNPRYTVQHIEVVSDGELKPALLEDLSGLRRGESLYSVSLRQVRENLEKIPRVARAEVRRELPATLRITVWERTPVARLGRDANGLHFVVDAEGRLLGWQHKTGHLPMIVGVPIATPRPGILLDARRIGDALRLVTAVNGMKLARHIPIRTISVGLAERLDVRLEDGWTLLIPRGPPDVVRLARVLEEARKSPRDSTVLDFTTGKNIIGKP